ncbi:AraC family transcriptional regulator [Nocardia sp. BMG111209]|uniref:AraC family transcriptional regulator n=1 Tax=Nocardia sp. BMG111209 TaxID=1160137 RepID=UPI00056D0D59|nr:AraC family transcriptional regulator [Nocardia sp. BMG111209]
MGDAPARQWSGDVVLRPGLLAFTGRIGPAGLHAHHTVGVNIALGGTVTLADADGRTTTATAFVVPADIAHRVVRGTGTGIVAQVEPMSRAGRVLTSMVADPGSVEAWAAAGASLAPPYPWEVAATSSAGTSHPAVARAIRLLTERASAGPVVLTEVADAVGLSESRLRHAFRAEVGLPFRPYVRWVRVLRAIEACAAGRSLTEAAHAAGFADSAHLSRTCRRMFGHAPSEFVHAGMSWAGAALVG